MTPTVTSLAIAPSVPEEPRVCGEQGCTEPMRLVYRSYGRDRTWLYTCPRDEQHQAAFRAGLYGRAA